MSLSPANRVQALLHAQRRRRIREVAETVDAACGPIVSLWTPGAHVESWRVEFWFQPLHVAPHADVEAAIARQLRLIAIEAADAARALERKGGGRS